MDTTVSTTNEMGCIVCNDENHLRIRCQFGNANFEIEADGKLAWGVLAGAVVLGGIGLYAVKALEERENAHVNNLVWTV